MQQVLGVLEKCVIFYQINNIARFRMFVEFLFIVITIVLALSSYIRLSRNGRFISKIPGPLALPVIGNLYVVFTVPTTMKELWALIRRWDVKYYPIYKLWTTHWGAVFITHPDDIEKTFANMVHIKKSIIYSILHKWLGFGLLTSDGEKWQKRRKMLTPAFHFNVLQKYFTSILENGEKTMDILRSKGEAVHDIVDMASTYTLNVICETAMGVAFSDEDARKKYRDGIHIIGESVLYRCMSPWFAPDFTFYNFSKKGRKCRKALKTLHEFTRKIIRERQEFHEKTNGHFLNEFSSTETSTDDIYCGYRKKRMAMLDLLIAAQRNGGLIDNAGIQEEVDTFTFEGHDTSSMALSFAILLIAEHTDVQERIRSEVIKIRNENNGELGISEVQRCNYLEMCIKECLRLYPSVQFISRSIEEDLQLTDYLVPGGTILQVNIYSVHRDPNFWPEPDKFDPERFTPDNCAGRHPFSYIPFSAGPRNCIGQKFAMLELKTFLAELVYNFHLVPIDIAANVPLRVDMVVRPDHPIHVKLVPIERK